MAPHRTGLTLVRTAALCAALCVSQRALASDFWDEVRSPGLGAQRIHLGKGKDALAHNQAELALQHADAAIARLPERADGHVLRGRALGALARHGEATAAFEQALLIMADALQAHGPAELRRAIATYREALVDSAFEKQALLGLALALHRAGEHDEALALAQRAGTKPDPTWLSPQELAARQALWLLAIGDRPAAEQAWARAAEGGHAWSDHARNALAQTRAGEP